MNKEFMKVIAALLIGIILGISGMNAYISREYEVIYAKNKTQEQQIREMTIDLEEMTEHMEKQQKNKIINDIKVEIELEADNNLPTFEKTSVMLDGKNKISDLLSSFKGQEVNTINYNLIPKIINGREFISEGRRYILSTDVVLITDQIQIYVTARLVRPK